LQVFFSGALIISGFNPISAIIFSLDTIVEQLQSDFNGKLLVFNLLMGAGIAYIWKLNGCKALTDWARTKIKTKKSASISAWLLGIIIFFDYFNPLLLFL
jgi:Na+/H+ antiporter NhaC